MNGTVPIVSSAVFRNNLAEFLEKIAAGRMMIISRFGQTKAVVVDKLTFKMQKTTMELLDKFPKLNKSEQETLNLLMDKKARESLIQAMRDLETGKRISGAAIFAK